MPKASIVFAICVNKILNWAEASHDKGSLREQWDSHAWHMRIAVVGRLHPCLWVSADTFIGWNNKVKADLTVSRVAGVQQSTSYVSYSCMQSCRAFTVKVEVMSDASHCHALSEMLKRDSEICLDSFGVTNHSRGHHPSTDRAVRGVLHKDWHLHRITSVVYSDRPLFYANTCHWLLWSSWS